MKEWDGDTKGVRTATFTLPGGKISRWRLTALPDGTVREERIVAPAKGAK
jgi:hypothetical protein